MSLINLDGKAALETIVLNDEDDIEKETSDEINTEDPPEMDKEHEEGEGNFSKMNFEQ